MLLWPFITQVNTCMGNGLILLIFSAFNTKNSTIKDFFLFQNNEIYWREPSNNQRQFNLKRWFSFYSWHNRGNHHFWYFKHQISTKICSKVFFKHNLRKLCLKKVNYTNSEDNLFNMFQIHFWVNPSLDLVVWLS